MSKPPSPVPAPGQNGRPPAVAPSTLPAWPTPVAAPGPGQSRARYEIRRYGAAVLRYRWLIAGLLALGLAGGAVATRFVPLTYVAQATLWIEGGASSAIDQGPIRTPELLQPQAWVDLMRSFVVLDSVVLARKLYIRHAAADRALFRDFEVREQFRTGDYVLAISDDGASYELLTAEGERLATGSVGDSIGAGFGFAWRPPREELRPGRRVSFSVDHPRDAARALATNLRATIDRGGTFLRIELAGTDPEQVAATVNAIADRHVEVAAALKREKLDQRAAILQQQLENAERNMREAEIALEAFRVATITLPSEPTTPIAAGIAMTRDPVIADFFTHRMDREQVRRDRQAILRVLEEFEQGRPLPIEALEAIGAVQGSSEMREALATLAAQRAQLRGLRLQYTDEHPSVRAVLESIEELEERYIPGLAFQMVAELAYRERELDAIIDAAATELAEIPVRASEEARLQRQVGIDEALYASLRHSFEQARLASLTTVPDVRILDRAAVPRLPVRDDRIRVFLLAVLGSLGLGLAGAFVLDRVDGRMRYPDQVTGELGLPVLGGVPRVGGNGKRGSDSVKAIEAFRSIRVNVAHAFEPGEPVVLAISSAGSGDGKSFVSGNLAVSFADQGRPTVLIDGDIRRGDVHRLIGVSRKPGLTDYLVGTHDVDDVIQTTAYRNLYFVGGGRRRKDGPELLGTERLAALLVQLRKRFPVVIVDTPPLGGAADAYLLAALTGNLLFVVRNGVTDRELAQTKLALLDHLPVRLIGAVLNAVPPHSAYGYYYGYYLPGYEVEEEDGAGAGAAGPVPALPG